MEASRRKQQVIGEYQTAMIAHTHRLSSCSKVGEHIEPSRRKQKVLSDIKQL